jgi:integrase/recombinase XerD
MPIYNQPANRRRIAGRFAEYLDGMASRQHACGYAESSVSKYRSSIVHLAVWCERRGILPAALDDAVVERFVRHARRCGCRPTGIGRRRKAAGGVRDACFARAFLRYLRSLNVVPSARPPSLPLVDEFADWLRHRGIADRTAWHCVRWSKLLIESLGDNPARYRPAQVRQFIATQSRKRSYQVATTRTVVSAIRSFLRYLTMHGRCDDRLVDALPTIASWRHAAVPRYLSPFDVERIISTPSRATATGRRDRAALLLLARLGLRSGEVARLRLNDIDWASRRIRVVGSKTGQVAWLPLPRDVAQALRRYVRNGRPPTSDEHVFVRSRAPFTAGRRTAMMSHLVVKALRQANVDAPVWGPQVFRHSLATKLLRKGWTLQAIGALLRHRHLETTAIYAKVDFGALRLVIQPWPDRIKTR